MLNLQAVRPNLEKLTSFFQGISRAYRYGLYFLMAVFVLAVLVAASNAIMFSAFYGMWFGAVRGAGLVDTVNKPISFVLAFMTLTAVPGLLLLSLCVMLGFRPKKLLRNVAVTVVPLLLIAYLLSMPKNGQLFNPITGEAVYKYSAQNGQVVLYNPGYNYDPKTGTKLEKVTPEVASRYWQQQTPPSVAPEKNPEDEDFPIKFSVSPQWATYDKDSDCELSVTGVAYKETTLSVRLQAKRRPQTGLLRSILPSDCKLYGRTKFGTELVVAANTSDGQTYVMKNGIVAEERNYSSETNQFIGDAYHRISSDNDRYSFAVNAAVPKLSDFTLNYHGTSFNITIRPGEAPNER